MNIIYLAVNYNSSETLKITLPKWKSSFPDCKIYIVDNFHSEDELSAVSAVCATNDANLICNANSGYGAGLNKGIAEILRNTPDTHDVFVMFGNCDITPARAYPEELREGYCPIFKIYHNGVNQNPYLKKNQLWSLFLLKYAAKYQSMVLKLCWIVVNKVLKRLQGEAVAVHGSLFCLSLRDLSRAHPIFDERVFLYQEEFFFMRALNNSNIKLFDSKSSFSHVGSVSTGSTIKKSVRSYFANWCKSMNIYFESEKP